MQKRKVVLHGILAKKYGKIHELCGDTIQVLMSGINMKHNGFKSFIASKKWQVVVGSKDTSYAVNEQNASMNLSNNNEIHIMPEAMGGSQAVQAVVGVVLVVVGAVTGNPYLIAAGVSLLVGAIMAPAPMEDALEQEDADNKPSFMFNGPVNVVNQGGPVPLVYGKMRTGSTVISGGIDVETWGENYDNFTYKGMLPITRAQGFS